MAPPISLQRFEIISNLGKGDFGRVYKISENKNGSPAKERFYAAKFQPFKEYESIDYKRLLKEMNLLRSSCPKFFPKLIYSFVIERGVGISYDHVLIMELGRGKHLNICHNRIHIINRLQHTGTLEYFALARNGNDEIPMFLRLCILRRVADALEYLHFECNIVHRDIKPTNIILNFKYVPLICDFGSSLQMQPRILTETVKFKF